MSRRAGGLRLRSGGEAIDADVVAALTRPAVAARFDADLDALREVAARGGLTWTPIFVRAAGLAAMAVPTLHRMHGPFHVFEPARADVGVSVAGEGILAPVVVIEGADGLSVDEVAARLKALARAARQDEPRLRALMDRFWWVVPFGWLRRLLVRAAFAFPAVRRRIAGTIQVSNVGLYEVEEAFVPMSSEILVVCGAVRETEAGLRGTFVLQASHLKLNGVTGGAFIRRFREVLRSPELFG